MAGHLGQDKRLNCLIGQDFVVIFASGVVSHSKNTVVPITTHQFPLQMNWHGIPQTIRMDCTKPSVCVSPSGLCSTPAGSSTSMQQHSMLFCGGALPCYLQRRDPERDPD